jgi:ATP-dependent Clp protease protease subunit
MAANTGQTFEKVERDAERDYWMSAAESKVYGLIDEVVTSKKPTDKKPA